MDIKSIGDKAKIKVEAVIDFTEGLIKINDGVKDTAKQINQLVTHARRVAQFSNTMAQVTGRAIDQTYAIGIEAGLRSVELVSSIIAAEALTGWGLVKAGAQIITIETMIANIILMKKGRADAARKMQQISAATSLFMY